MSPAPFPASECGNAGCARRPGPRRLFCDECWALVPQDDRREIMWAFLDGDYDRAARSAARTFAAIRARRTSRRRKGT